MDETSINSPQHLHGSAGAQYIWDGAKMKHIQDSAKIQHPQGDADIRERSGNPLDVSIIICLLYTSDAADE